MAFACFCAVYSAFQVVRSFFHFNRPRPRGERFAGQLLLSGPPTRGRDPRSTAGVSRGPLGPLKVGNWVSLPLR